MKRSLLVAALLCCGAKIAFAVVPPAQLAESGIGTANAERELAPASVAEAVRQRVGRLDGIDAENIKVLADGRTVTLSGPLRDRVSAVRIVEAASAVRGVENVIAEFDVRTDLRPPAELSKDVLAALAHDPSTADLAIDVSVDGTAVTLTGTVGSWPEKRLAGWITDSVRGVSEVRNQLHVAVESRTDGAIQADIKRRFVADPLVNDGIEVSVQLGNVVLAGEVTTALEKTWAIADAHVTGVVAVDATGLRVNPNLVARGNGAPPALTDQAIQQTIIQGLANDPRVRSGDVGVTVTAGRVTLSGAVPTLSAKAAAEQIASRLAGVSSVASEIALRDERRDQATVARELRAALNRTHFVDGGNIVVTNEDGVVTLSGAVASAFEKWVASDIARRTRGVSEIRNHLNIHGTDGERPQGADSLVWHSSLTPWVHRANEPRTDLELLAAVRDELFWSPYFGNPPIAVAAENGTVTLRGQVCSHVAKSMVERLAYDAGAEDVRNLLHVNRQGS